MRHSEDYRMYLAIVKESFPFFVQGRNKQVEISHVTLVIVPSIVPDTSTLNLELLHGTATVSFGGTTSVFEEIGNALSRTQPISTEINGAPWQLALMGIPGEWQEGGRLNPDAIENTYIICHYTVSTTT